MSDRARLRHSPPGQGFTPDTPHQCVSAQCNFRFSSASSPTRSLRSVAGAAASGIISRMLSVIRCCSFGDESSDSPSNALSSSQTHETGFKCPSGHGRREKRLQSVSGGQARHTPNQGLSGRLEPASPASPFARYRQPLSLVGDRRPSVLQRWGLGFSQTVSGCAQGAAGTVAARSFWRSGSKNTQGI